ncbi:mannose-6-phosphate isomerase [Sporosarcina newyorkensis 2681]|uniref:Mannose-6-phosphate isomerase n=1 Tax=Sporosarcina newyorkensis 2681 TaxID=1027292 RepID=F9DQ66_9BACL|nr:sugar phosphate nucleotidyltransferase [Sporosarcina newyorkensis]EGQ27063.1 mannose-6-phosphate isomerase [Sporosarcina newyorkensis 2681]
MKLILLSGGSGTRLWPLSNDSRAKQFLKVLRNEETDEFESMLQRVFRQLSSVVSTDDMIVATNATQTDMLRSQIGSIPIVVEPERRDTFPAIALACVYLFSKQGVRRDEIVGVVSVDSFVDPVFYKRVNELGKLVHETDAEMGLLGVKPTYPSSKYGYLLPKRHTDYMEVDRFVEKPTEEEAVVLIEQENAYWNSGVFAFPVSLVLDLLIEKGLPVEYDALLEQFSSLPKNSFDYEIVEKLANIVALTYDGYWKDLGTWNTLTEEMTSGILGNGAVSDDCVNTHIVNELELPVKVLGVSNAVVAVSADGILVTDKPASSRMKDMLLDGLFSRPMYEERRWGWYRVLDVTKKEEREVLTKRLCVHKGKNLSYQYHHHRDETWTIISGLAIFVLDGEKKLVQSGDVIQIPAGAKHALYAETETEFIEVQIGQALVENDIVRVTEDWTETISYCLKH